MIKLKLLDCLFFTAKKLKSPSVFLIFIFFSVDACGQVEVGSSSIPKLNAASVSPEAASLGKYGDIPVGLHTGVPDISIPIYTITLKDIKIPISLSYHSSGIKVDEVASNVGLGWTLNYGGMISQSVNGISDLNDNGWLHVLPLQKFPQDRYLRTVWNSNDYQHDQEYEYMTKISSNEFDTQPDMFNVSLLGRSFKYFYNQEGAIFTIPYQKVSINTNKLIDENDIVYEFAIGESTRTKYDYYGVVTPSENVFSTTAYLSKITTPAGNTVIYEYEDYNYEFENQGSETRYAKIPNQEGCASVNPQPSHTESKSFVAGKRIKRIVSSTGIEVTFIYGIDRLDLLNTKALTGIQIKDGTNPNSPMKNYTLNYGYYDSGSYYENSVNRYRLKLLSVIEEGGRPWTLHYNEGIIPGRLEKSQDHWGYYNAKKSATLLPEDSAKGFNSGADRSPDTSVVTNGILNQIIYPTGGKTTFEYEANDTYTSYKVPGGYQNVLAMAENNSTVVVPFTVTDADMSTFYATYEAGLEDGTLRYLDPESNEYGDCEVYLKDATGNVLKLFYGNSGLLGQPMTGLYPGNYSLVIKTSGPGNQSFINVSITWYTNETTMSTNKITGGVRVKRVTDSPIIGVPQVKTYEYRKKSDPGKSSGVQAYNPIYIRDHFVELVYGIELENQFYFDCKVYAQTSSSLLPLNVMQGNSVGYSEVNVYSGGKDRGYTYNKLSSTFGGPVSWEYPFPPIITDDWANGLPLETIDYIWNEGTFSYSPVKKVVNEYEFNNPSNRNVIRGAVSVLLKAPYQYNNHFPTNLVRGPEFKISYYDMVSSWFYKKKTIETTYNSADSTKKIVSEHNFFYENPSHIQLTREEIDKNSDEKYKVVYKYAKDYNPSFAYNSSPVVEKRIFLKKGISEVLLNSEITTYKLQPGSFPLTYYGLKNIAGRTASLPFYDGANIDLNNYERRRDYVYDASNNVSSFVTDGKLKKSLLWSNHNQYVMAEVVNSDPNEIYHQNFEEQQPFDINIKKDGSRKFTGEFSGKIINTTASQMSSDGVTWINVNLSSAKRFTYTGWVYSDGPSVDISLLMKRNGESTSYSYIDSKHQDQTGKWVFVQKEFLVPADVTQMSLRLTNNSMGTVWFDDLNLYPADAYISTFTHNPMLGITSSIDSKGMIRNYIYDAMQRLKTVTDDKGNIISAQEYHFKP